MSWWKYVCVECGESKPTPNHLKCDDCNAAEFYWLIDIQMEQA